MQEVAITVFRLLVYLGDTNLNNLNPPSEWALGYRGFHCISVDKLSFFNTTFTLECSFKFLLRAHAGFIVAQLKTLSISGGCQRKNNTLIRDGPFCSLGTAMYLKEVFSLKLFYHQKFRKLIAPPDTPPSPLSHLLFPSNKIILSAGCSFQVLINNQKCQWATSFYNLNEHQTWIGLQNTLYRCAQGE